MMESHRCFAKLVVPDIRRKEEADNLEGKKPSNNLASTNQRTVLFPLLRIQQKRTEQANEKSLPQKFCLRL